MDHLRGYCLRAQGFSLLLEGRKVYGMDGALLIWSFTGDCDRERFVVLSLNTKNEPITRSVVPTGSLNASTVHPRRCIQNSYLIA